MKTRPRNYVLLISTIFGISLFAIILDLGLVSPVHEFGHFLACLALGVRVHSIGWNHIVFASVSDWRQNVIGYSGGLFAALFLSGLYMLSTISLPHIHPQTKRGMLRTRYISLLVKSTLLTDMMVQLTGAALEGTSLTFYQLLVTNVFTLYTVTLIFSGVSFFVIVRLRKTVLPFES